MHVARVFSLLFLLAAVSLAQPPNGAAPSKLSPAPPFTSSPPIEDRYLYYSFFTSQAAIFAANDAAKVSNPSGATAIDQQAATTLHVQVADLATVETALKQATQLYAQITSQRQAKITASNLKLSPAQIAGLDDLLRLDATAKTIFALVKQLPASSWAGLHSYITVDFKKTYKDPRLSGLN